MHHFKYFSRVKSTQDKKVRFIRGNELKLTQVDLLSFFIFKNVNIVQSPLALLILSREIEAKGASHSATHSLHETKQREIYMQTM